MYLQLIACLCRLEIIMKNKGNQKHLNSVLISRKVLLRIKPSLKLDELLVKIHLPYQRKYVSTHIQKNVRIQVTLILHVFIERTVRWHACVIRCVAFIVSFAENHPFAALIYVPHMRQLNVRNWINHPTYVMAVVKRPIVLCPESFIHPNMPMMSTVAC